MCGLNGIFSFAGPPVEKAVVERMRDCMQHRGPDGAGIWISADGRVGLGHRRLSIIDLSSAAAQPMTNEDGSVQLVFNGEIYNHAEIRAELQGLGGHCWRTDHSDTEVIIHAYEQWGIDCIERFRGMFAFALWDARQDRLWMVRDRVGIKPLYYARTQGRVVFASEIKALFRVPEVPRKLDEEALYHCLSFLTPPAPLTMFAGVEKLPAGSRAMIDGTGTIHMERYWDPWDHTKPLIDVPEGDIAERLLDELRVAVRYRKVSDVPQGVFLSGGIDSSVNTALFSEDGGPVQTFSIGFDAEYPSYRSELGDARRMAMLIGAQHHERRLGVGDVIEFVERMVYHQDEPIADVVCVPLYYVAKLARDAGVIVCQVGEGSDELFCGYPFWKQHLRIAHWNALPVPRGAKRAALAAMALAGRGMTYEYEVLRRAASGEPTFWGGAEGLTEGEKQFILGPELRARFSGTTSAVMLEPIQRRFKEKAWEQSALHWMTYLDLNIRLPELLLGRVDKMTMATAVEARVPFLDHKFVELALSIPTSVKVADGELKHILKRAVRGVIPDDIIDRKKQGFGLPMREWLAGGLGEQIERRVQRFADETGIFDGSRVSEYLRTANWSKVWMLFNIAAWHERFIAGDAQAP